jgi:hypothetical protein
MRLDDGAADSQPKAHALRLGRDEGLEDSLQVLARDASSVVRDLQQGVPARGKLGADEKRPRRLGVGHRVAGVEKVQQHLLQLDSAAGDERWPRRELGADLDLTAKQVAAHKREYLAVPSLTPAPGNGYVARSIECETWVAIAPGGMATQL